MRGALGAGDGRILRMVMRASGVQILLGVGIGMTLLPLMGRGLGDILGDVSPYDPGIYSMVIGLMITVAVIATLAPTRRALKVDPAAALRYEGTRWCELGSGDDETIGVMSSTCCNSKPECGL